MPRVRTWALTAFALVVAAPVLFAQANPLSVIPDDALGFVMVKNMAESSARLRKVTDKAFIPVPDVLTLAKTVTGIEKGLDDQGGIAAAVLPDGDAARGLSLVIFAPVTDYAVFIEQLDREGEQDGITTASVAGEKCLVARKGSFAVFCEPSRRELLKRVVASPKALAESLEPIKPWIEAQNLIAVATPPGKKMLLDAIVRAIPDQLPAGIARPDAQPTLPLQPARQFSRETLALTKKVITTLEDQLTFLGIGMRIDPDATVHIAARALFKPGGELSRWGKSVTLPQRPLLAGLPPGKFAVAYGGVAGPLHPDVDRLLNRLADMGLRQYGLNEEAVKKIEEISLRQRVNQISTCAVLGLLRPGDSIVSPTITVKRVKSAAEHLAATRELMALVKGSNSGLYEINEVTVGDLAAIETVLDMPGASRGDNAPNETTQTMLVRLFGGDGKLRNYTAAADETTIVEAYTKEQLARGVAHVRTSAKGLEVDGSIGKTAALLPAGAQWTAYASPQGLLQWTETLLRTFLPDESKLKIPSFAASEPIGLAVRVSETELDAEMVLPDSVISALGQFVPALQELIQGGGLPLP